MILTVTPPLHSNCQEGGVILKLSSLDIGGVQKAIRVRDQGCRITEGKLDWTMVDDMLWKGVHMSQQAPWSACSPV